MTLTAHDLVARSGINNALALHSRGVDRADFNLLSAAYHPDATVDYGFFAGPAETLVAILAEAQKPSLPTLHRTSNIWVKVAGDEAVSESYVMAYVEDPALQRLVMGRYLDRHHCRDGQWRLSHRTYLIEGNINRANTSQRADPPVDHAHYVPSGAKGSADPGRALMALAQAGFSGACAMTAQTDSTALDIALSKAAIHDLSMAYCRGVDRGDKELLNSLFHPDSTALLGISNGSGADFAEAIVPFVRDELDYCFHSVANEWVEVHGDHAIGELYALAHMTKDGQDVMTGGRYIDHYERRDGMWKIKSRTFVTDWNTSHPTTLQNDGFYDALKNWGSFGKEDPVYAHWASIRS